MLVWMLLRMVLGVSGGVEFCMPVILGIKGFVLVDVGQHVGVPVSVNMIVLVNWIHSHVEGMYFLSPCLPQTRVLSILCGLQRHLLNPAIKQHAPR